MQETFLDIKKLTVHFSNGTLYTSEYKKGTTKVETSSEFIEVLEVQQKEALRTSQAFQAEHKITDLSSTRFNMQYVKYYELELWVEG